VYHWRTTLQEHRHSTNCRDSDETVEHNTPSPSCLDTLRLTTSDIHLVSAHDHRLASPTDDLPVPSTLHSHPEILLLAHAGVAHLFTMISQIHAVRLLWAQGLSETAILTEEDVLRHLLCLH